MLQIVFLSQDRFSGNHWHLVPNQEIGMARAFLIDDSSLVFRKMDTTPSHRQPP